MIPAGDEAPGALPGAGPARLAGCTPARSLQLRAASFCTLGMFLLGVCAEEHSRGPFTDLRSSLRSTLLSGTRFWPLAASVSPASQFHCFKSGSPPAPPGFPDPIPVEFGIPLHHRRGDPWKCCLGEVPSNTPDADVQGEPQTQLGLLWNGPVPIM